MGILNKDSVKINKQSDLTRLYSYTSNPSSASTTRVTTPASLHPDYININETTTNDNSLVTLFSSYEN